MQTTKELDLEFDYQYSFQDFASDCYLFNELAGKDTKCSFTDMYQQSMLVHEEVLEIIDGIRHNNPEEVLDGAIDVLVVTLGLLQKLEQLGVDTSKAMQKTAINNFSKFPTDRVIAVSSVDSLKEQGVDCKFEYNEEYQVYVIKDANDKVRKPVGFESNDLLDCIPNKLQELGFDKE